MFKGLAVAKLFTALPSDVILCARFKIDSIPYMVF